MCNYFIACKNFGNDRSVINELVLPIAKFIVLCLTISQITLASCSLVTSSSTSIGLWVGRTLAENGRSVVCTAVRQPHASTAREICRRTMTAERKCLTVHKYAKSDCPQIFSLICRQD